MPYNSALEEKIDARVKRWKGLAKKKMFGGVGYLLNGNLCVGIWRDFLIVRMDRDQAAKSLRLRNVRPFDITGTAMAGWIMVSEAGWKRTAGRERWLGIAKAFAGNLPARTETKGVTKRTLKEHRAAGR